MDNLAPKYLDYTIYLDNLDGTAQRRGGCFPALPGWSTLVPPFPH